MFCLVWVAPWSKVAVGHLCVLIMRPRMQCFRLPPQLLASYQTQQSAHQHRSPFRVTFVSTSRLNLTDRTWCDAVLPRWASLAVVQLVVNIGNFSFLTFLQHAAMLCGVFAVAFLSVCASHTSIVSEWMNVGWCHLHWWLAQGIQISTVSVLSVYFQGVTPSIDGERVWLSGIEIWELLTHYCWLIYCSIGMLCMTTKGHIWQVVNNKLFSDGLISMKFNLQVT